MVISSNDSIIQIVIGSIIDLHFSSANLSPAPHLHFLIPLYFFVVDSSFRTVISRPWYFGRSCRMHSHFTSTDHSPPVARRFACSRCSSAMTSSLSRAAQRLVRLLSVQSACWPRLAFVLAAACHRLTNNESQVNDNNNQIIGQAESACECNLNQIGYSTTVPVITI